MITRYDKYIKESIDNDMDILLDFLENFKSKYIYIDSDIDYNEVYVCDSENDNNLINIKLESNEYYIYTLFDNIKVDEYTDIDKLMIDIKNDFDNFYDILKKTDIIKDIKRNNLMILDIPIINIEKYCDFIIYCYENVNIDVLVVFIERVYNNENFKDIKKVFDIKYKYLIEANNFDLL